MKRKRLTKSQRRRVREIMERENPQRKVDEIVAKTKQAMEICEKEAAQTKVNKIVEDELRKM